MKYKYLMAIVVPKYEEEALKLMRAHDMHGISVVLGQGSARRELFELFGLEDNKRYLITGFVAEDREEDILAALNKFVNQNGAGIALTLQIDGYIGLKSVFTENV